jgi:hypothetical protein
MDNMDTENEVPVHILDSYVATNFFDVNNFSHRSYTGTVPFLIS